MPWDGRAVAAAGATLGFLGLVGAIAWVTARERPRAKAKRPELRPGDDLPVRPEEPLPKDRPDAPPVALPAEVYRGFSVYVDRPQAAYRWVVAFERTPLALGHAVLPAEALQAGKNWVDLLFEKPPEPVPVPEGEVLPVPYAHATWPTPGEPTDLALPHWFVLSDYWILVQFSGTGFVESEAFPKTEHWRWRVIRDDKVLVTGWAATARDARDEANVWVASDLYVRGVKWIVD